MQTECVIRPVAVPGRVEPCYVREFDLAGYQRWLKALVAAAAKEKPAPAQRLATGFQEPTAPVAPVETPADLRELAVALTWCDATGKLLHPSGQIAGFADKLSGRLMAALWLETADLNCLLAPTAAEVAEARDFFPPTPPSSIGSGWRGIFRKLTCWRSAKNTNGRV
jgi:hypothetical protein